MIVILGLIILVAAVVVAVAGVLGNAGAAHALTHGFAVFGYHVTGSTGRLFLCGVVVGAAGLAGLSVLLAGVRRTSRRGRTARRSLSQSRRETAAASQARDDLIAQRETARAYTASDLGSGALAGRQPDSDDNRWSRLRLFGHRSPPRQAPASRQATVAHPESLNGRLAPDVPAGASAPAE
jgi:hypothetical protein